MLQTIPHHARDDRERRLALWSGTVTGALLALWTLFAGESGRYILYLMPVALISLHALFHDFRLQIDTRATYAFALYLAIATLSIIHADALGPFTTRDVVVIACYLVLFIFALQPTPAAVDIVSLGLIVGMAIEGARQGISLTVDMLGSQGILESSLAFPLGAVLLYNVSGRRWWQALVVGLFFFAAYKRIALLAVLAILLLAFVIRFLHAQRYERRIVVASVLALSAMSLFSMPFFEWIATLTAAEGVSANSISLGRFELISVLWRNIYQADWTNIVFGHGPGAADEAVAAAIEGAANPHNDWMKILYDYGVSGVIVMHIVLYLTLARTRFSRMLYLYAGIVMTTDNTFIYLYHQSVIYLLVRASLPQDPKTAQAGAPY